MSKRVRREDGEIESGVAPTSAPESALAEAVESTPRERDEVFESYQRLAADFENFKRRTRQERAELMQYANEALLVQLLPILDNFHRAMEHAPADSGDGWVDGMRLILRQMEEVLESAGLSPIAAEGASFDPTLHEAVLSDESSGQPDNTVLAELRRGYRLRDKVVRPTLVKVASSHHKEE